MGRTSVKVSLTDEAKKHLDEVVDRLGMKQQEALGRLLDWFRVQPPEIQLIAVKQVSGDTADDLVAALWRRRHGAGEAELLEMLRRLVPLLDEGSGGRRPAKTGSG